MSDLYAYKMHFKSASDSFDALQPLYNWPELTLASVYLISIYRMDLLQAVSGASSTSGILHVQKNIMFLAHLSC